MESLLFFAISSMRGDAANDISGCKLQHTYKQFCEDDR